MPVKLSKNTSSSVDLVLRTLARDYASAAIWLAKARRACRDHAVIEEQRRAVWRVLYENDESVKEWRAFLLRAGGPSLIDIALNESVK